MLYTPICYAKSTNLDCSKHVIYCQIKANSPNIDSKYAMTLSNMIYKAAKKHKIPTKVYTAILMQESSYKLGAVGSSCGFRTPASDYDEQCVYADFGIAQINYKTIKHYEMDKEKLLKDLEYSVNAGAKVLQWFHKTYHKREPYRWWNRYNCGTKKSVLRDTCQKYHKNVSRWL